MFPFASTSTGLEMHSDLARKLFDEGAVLLVLNLPTKTEFGIDMKSWTTAHKFKGIKMIPPGYHFLYYNAVNSHGDVAPRISFFHNFKPKEILVKIWNNVKEELENKILTEEEIENIKSDLQNLDPYLGAYPYDVLDLWRNLTTYITDDIMSNIYPECGVIRSASELIADKSNIKIDENIKPQKKLKWGRLQNEEEKEEALLPHLIPIPGTQIRYSEPKEFYPLNSTPSEISYHCIDKTYTLEQILKQYNILNINPLLQQKEQEQLQLKQSIYYLLGEFQFSFICFLLGLHYNSFIQWKNLFELICSCDLAIEKYNSFYIKILNLINIQLFKCNEKLIENNNELILNINNYLFKFLIHLFNIIKLSNKLNNKKLLIEIIEEIKKNIYENSEFNEDDNYLEEDECPVVVELHE